jgi:hypothetical protein
MLGIYEDFDDDLLLDAIDLLIRKNWFGISYSISLNITDFRIIFWRFSMSLLEFAARMWWECE